MSIMIIQNASEDGTTDLTFTVSKTDHKKALSIVEQTLPALKAKGVKVDTDITKVSVVGVGMRTHDRRGLDQAAIRHRPDAAHCLPHGAFASNPG